MHEGLLFILIGACFILGLGGLANVRVRQEASRPRSPHEPEATNLSRATRTLMLTAFGGFGLTIAAAALTRAWPLSSAIDGWPGVTLSAVGVALMAVGAVVVVSVFIGSRKDTWAVDTDNLATTGIYGRTRNPRAVGWFLVYAGLALATGSAAALVLAPIYLLGYLPWILLEEVALERHFGDLYRAYRHRTPRFI